MLIADVYVVVKHIARRFERWKKERCLYWIAIGLLFYLLNTTLKLELYSTKSTSFFVLCCTSVIGHNEEP